MFVPNNDGLYGVEARSLLSMSTLISKYRLELLPIIPAFHRRARKTTELDTGQLVYYGPQPTYYGIGEVKHQAGRYVAVDFRGTGHFRVHEDVFEPQYLIPIPSGTMSLL